MKKITAVSLIALAATAGFLSNTQPASAHGRFYRYYPYYIRPLTYCFPVTQLWVDEDPAYHPHAYSDGYRQGQESAEDGDKYKPRTAGGEFGRGFRDGYYGMTFAGQKIVVPNTIEPYTTTNCY